MLDNSHKVLRDNLKTAADGKLQVTNLAPGKYYFKETKAPAGYQLSEQLISFTISATHSGKPAQVEVIAKNQLIPNKSNTTNKPKTPEQGYYPKTGEEKGVTLLSIGAIIVLVVVGIAYVRKRK